MKGIFILLSTVFVVLTGCSKTVPRCDDVEVVDLMTEIALEKVANKMPDSAADSDNLSFSVGSVTMISLNANNGAYTCGSVINMIYKDTGEEVDFPFTYIVKIEQQTKDLNVEVFDL